MTIMLRKEQRAASGEGKTARKFQSNYHMITVGGKWAVTGRSGQIRPAPYSKTTGHFHSDSLTSPMTEQKENGQPALQDILMLLHPLPQRLQLFGLFLQLVRLFLGCLFPLPVIDIGIHSLLHYAAEHLLALRFQQMVGKMNIITHFQIHPLFREA